MERVSARERLCYAAGDGGAVLLLEMCGLYQVYFCTDVLGLGAAAAGIVVAVSRTVGALADLPAGLLVDRVRTKWGRYRPSVVVLALPLAAAAALSFAVPTLSQAWRFAYAAVAFSLFQILYAMQNTAYGALLGVVTQDDDERTRLASRRFGFVMAALFVVQSLAMPLAGRIGWTRTAAAVAALALPLLVVSGIGVRERVPLSAAAAGPLSALGRAVASAPVRWLMLAGFSMAAADALMGASLTYYFPYVATQHEVTFGLYNAVGIAFGFLSLAWLPSRLVRRLPPVRALVPVWLAAGLALAAFRVLPTDAVVSLLALKAVLSLATAAAAALFWSVVARTAVACGAGGAALVTALACFSQKAGGAAGASGLAFALSGTGFVPHAGLSAPARELVRLAMSVLPALLLVLAAWSASRVAVERKER